jgi:hypothetical protein
MSDRRTTGYRTPEDVARLVRRFSDCTLPYEEWTHEAHLVVGLWFLTRHSLRGALPHMRTGIRRYNVACGIVNSDTTGYHETITCFYLRIIQHFLSCRPGNRPLHTLATALIHSHSAAPTLAQEYYSGERLFSAAARDCWVAPDRRPMPETP